MNHHEKVNTIKARALLGETINDQELLSYAINALNDGDASSHEWLIKRLNKPISKQSNILLLELYRIILNSSNYNMAERLTKILLNKTSQSFVIDTLMSCKNFKLRGRLIEFIKQNTKFKASNEIYFYYALYKIKKITRKAFVDKIDVEVKKLTKRKNTDYHKLNDQIKVLKNNPNYDWDCPWNNDPHNPHFPAYFDAAWEENKIEKQNLINVMNLSILFAKIGLAKRGEALFLKVLDEIREKRSILFKDLFDTDNNGYRYRANEKRFTDGICDFDEITKFLDTDYLTYFKKPYNCYELEVTCLRSTKPLLFAQEFSKYALSNKIMQAMMDIHISLKFRHKDIFGVTELIERVMNENYYWSVKNAFIEHFFKKQHFSSKIAYLIFPKLAEQLAGVDIIKLKNTFTNKCLREGISPAHFEWENRFVYSGMAFNTFAFKYIYQSTQDKNIKNWLEDLCAASMLVRYDGTLDRSFDMKELKRLSQIFVDADKFYKTLEKKIIALTHPGRHNVNYLSIDNAIELLRNARVSNDETANKLADHFIQNVRHYPSTKYLLAERRTRRRKIERIESDDFFANKKFRDELNKFMLFVFHDNAYKYNVSLTAYERFVCIFCNRKVYSLYKQLNPFIVLDAKYSPAPPSLVNKVRLKKIDNEFSKKSKDELFQLLNMETKSLNGGSYKRIIFLMNKIFEKSSSFNPKKFLENSLFKNMHISSKLETLYYLKNTSHNDNDFAVIKTSKSFRDELENFYNELVTEISFIDINSFRKYKDKMIYLISYNRIKGLSETFFKKFPSEIFDFMWDGYGAFYNKGIAQPGYSEKAINKALEHKINQFNKMSCILDNDVYFIEEIIKFYHVDRWEYSHGPFSEYSKDCHRMIRESAPNIQSQLFIHAKSFFEGKNLTTAEEFNSFKNILAILLRICQRFNKKYPSKFIQTIFYSNFLEFLKKNEVNIINNENYRDLVLQLSGEVNNARANSILDLNFKNKFFKYYDDLVIKTIHENKIPLDKFSKLGIEDSKYEIIGWSFLLEKGNPVNENQETALNKIPLTQDMYSLCKKFNAPYWATQLNLFEKLM